MDEKEKGLKTTTVWLMIMVALFFDVLQILLDFLLLGWLVPIIAAPTFWLWFRIHGISFMKPKRFLTFGGATLVDFVPVLGWFAWMVAVSYLALSSKLQSIVPGADITKLDIMKR